MDVERGRDLRVERPGKTQKFDAPMAAMALAQDAVALHAEGLKREVVPYRL
jgi:hypothetical protein